MDDTPTGETVTSEAPSNDANPTAAAPANAVDPAEVERLRKEKEQAEMRANQLANQLKAKEEAEASAKAKQLEENEQFKELWEKERQEKEALIAEREAAQHKAELTSATDNLLQNYSPAVQELARTAGLSLNDDSDEAQADLKAKLDTFASKIGSPRVEANNPAPTVPTETSNDRDLETMRMNNVPRKVNEAATRKVISGLSAIKEMKKMNGIPEVPAQ